MTQSNNPFALILAAAAVLRLWLPALAEPALRRSTGRLRRARRMQQGGIS